MANAVAITSAIGGTVGVLKEIGRLAKGVGNREINEHIIDLQQRIIDLQQMFTDLTGENEVLRRQVADLEISAKMAGELKFEESVYWRFQDGKKVSDPLCPNCWDNERKQIHLIRYGVPGAYRCGVCKSTGFHTAEFKEPSQHRAVGPRPTAWS